MSLFAFNVPVSYESFHLGYVKGAEFTGGARIANYIILDHLLGQMSPGVPEGSIPNNVTTKRDEQTKPAKLLYFRTRNSLVMLK